MSSPHLPSWLHSRGPGSPGGFSRALALSLSGGSLFLNLSARRTFSSAASASSGTANVPHKASFLERFPLKAALTAGTLALTGDAIAQINERRKRQAGQGEETQDLMKILEQHDAVRALRMASYGFLLYGPFSHLWYQVLERHLPGATAKNLALKVVANQVILGPCVLLVVFAWNFTWMGKMKDIPDKYRRDFVPALVDGWKFWIPASVLNFGLIPLQFRVAYMSTCAIFWNFYLSSSVGKDIQKAKQ